MKTRLITLVVFLSVAMILGMILAAGGGAIYPPLYRAADLLLCAGEMQITTSAPRAMPGGGVGVTHTVTCLTTSGEAQDITVAAVIVSGLIYGSGIFLILVILVITRLLSPSPLRHLDAPPDPIPSPSTAPGPAQAANTLPGEKLPSDPEAALQKLKEMRQRGLISAAEYDEKRAKILDQL